jgi:hypothetical protein
MNKITFKDGWFVTNDRICIQHQDADSKTFSAHGAGNYKSGVLILSSKTAPTLPSPIMPTEVRRHYGGRASHGPGEDGRYAGGGWFADL